MYWTNFKKIKFQDSTVMNNIPSSSKNGRFVTIETVKFEIRSSEKHMFGFNHSNYVVKTDFFEKSSLTIMLAICYSNIQSHF